MDKVLIEVVTPATSKSYDFWIPKAMTVEQATARIAKDIMLYEMNEKLFDMKKEIFLYLYENRTLLNAAFTMEQAGVRSGNKLMII